MKTESFNILLVENIHPIAQERLEAEGFNVDLLTYSPSEDELISLLGKYQALGIRSKTQITQKILDHSKHLFAIGAFCIGTNQIELKESRRRAVPVFNAPHSNTRSVAELVIAEMISLSRQLTDRSMRAHQGDWDKSALGSKEVRGKTLGIVGYGHIGSQVSILAESLGLRVYFFDTVKKLSLGNARAVNSLEELLERSDFITLHVPEAPENVNMIGSEQLSLMKKGSYLINASRGSVVDIDALAEVLESGHLAGAAIDVFPTEPSSNKEKFHSRLQGIKNVILTPHIGGSTEEAQKAIGEEVAESFRRFLKNGSTSGAVNFPNVDLPTKKETSRIINVHQNRPGVLSEINKIVSETGANIEGQYLSTDDEIGYLVIDVNSSTAAKEIETKIKALTTSIKTRVVY